MLTTFIRLTFQIESQWMILIEFGRQNRQKSCCCRCCIRLDSFVGIYFLGVFCKLLAILLGSLKSIDVMRFHLQLDDAADDDVG